MSTGLHSFLEIPRSLHFLAYSKSDPYFLPFGPILTSSYLIMVFACLHAFFLHYGLSLRPEEENILLFKDSGDYDV